MTTTNDEKQTPGTNFPGLKLGTTLAESWLRVLTDQASLFNDAWRRVTAGTFGFGDYTRTAATLWESYVRAFADAIRAPLQSGGAPQWVTFRFDKEKPALKRTVSLPAAQIEAAQLAVTPLHAIGSGEVIDKALITVAVPAGNLRRDTLEIMVPETSRLPSKDGQYMGFVYDRRAQGGPPLIVILLTIDHSG